MEMLRWILAVELMAQLDSIAVNEDEVVATLEAYVNSI